MAVHDTQRKNQTITTLPSICVNQWTRIAAKSAEFCKNIDTKNKILPLTQAL